MKSDRQCPRSGIAQGSSGLIPGILFLFLFPLECLAQEQLLPVFVEGRGGYINESGRMVIPPQFFESHPFSDGLALVRKGNDAHLTDSRLGYVNPGGEFHEIAGAGILGEYREGLARAQFNSRRVFLGTSWCFIDLTGSVVIRSEYDNVGDFSEGLAWVEVRVHILFFLISDSFGYIDRTGAPAIPVHFESAGNFSEGRANVTLKGKKGYINHKGEFVIAPRFDGVGPFSTGLAAVRIGDRWGFVDTLGSMVIPPAFEDARPFVDGLAAVKSGGNWGFIRRSGETAIAPQYSDVSGFHQGLSAVQIEGKWGYIDTTGALRIRPQFDYAMTFWDGAAMVEVEHRRGYIDPTGKYIWQSRQ
jgi:hypothetical protein